MKVTITGKNIEVSEYLRDLALKKIAKLERYFPEDTEVLITMAVEKNRHIVEVTIPYQGGIIRGEESTGDMYASIDNVIAKLEKQIHRHKTRRCGAQPCSAAAFLQRPFCRAGQGGGSFWYSASRRGWARPFYTHLSSPAPKSGTRAARDWRPGSSAVRWDFPARS